MLTTRPDNRGGYSCVRMRIGKKRTRPKSVHVLVALAFLGPRPAGLHVCHRNGDKTDNRPENLMYATPAENVRQSVEDHRTFIRGERVHTAKLTAAQVAEIKRRRDVGESLATLSAKFGVAMSNISAIARGRTWRHISLVAAAPAMENTA
jgi:hypothetical protein